MKLSSFLLYLCLETAICSVFGHTTLHLTVEAACGLNLTGTLLAYIEMFWVRFFYIVTLFVPSCNTCTFCLTKLCVVPVISVKHRMSSDFCTTPCAVSHVFSEFVFLFSLQVRVLIRVSSLGACAIDLQLPSNTSGATSRKKRSILKKYGPYLRMFLSSVYVRYSLFHSQCLNL